MNLLNRFSFELPTRIDYGVGAAKGLVDVIKNLNARKVLLVTDKGVVSSGLLERITGPLAADKLKWKVFDNVEPNPKDYNVQQGTEIASRFDPDCLVALGGGSPIDCAKAIAVVARQGGAVRNYEGPNKIGADVAAVHCVAEALGGKYDAAHGICNAIVLPAVMAYNLEYCKERYARIAAAMGLACENVNQGAQQAVKAVQKLASDVHLPGFNCLGVQEKDLEELAVNSFKNGSNIDNPRPMKKEDYLNLFRLLSG